MNKQEVLVGLESFRQRLIGDVVGAYEKRGGSFGRERFDSWRRKFTQFLNENLPGEVSTLNSKLSPVAYFVDPGESDAQRFWQKDGETMLAYIDSLKLDVENDEYDFPEDEVGQVSMALPISGEKNLTQVFIVHGHDDEAKERTARFVEKLGFKAIILHEQASRGRTIIEKIEKHSNVGFAIVLYTPDDLGNVKPDAEKNELNARARQNVIFEHGYLIGKLGRENVVALVERSIELPSDISGMVYIANKDWQVNIAKEMKGAGYEIDFNKLC